MFPCRHRTGSNKLRVRVFCSVGQPRFDGMQNLRSVDISDSYRASSI